MAVLANAADTGRVVGRYVLYDEIASGGMATIHLGRMIGQVGFARTVAIKRLHPHFARDPEFVAMFIDEARLAAGIRHPNVVSTLDVVALEGDLFLVMEYVEGDSLSHLVKQLTLRDQRTPPPVVSGIVSNVLYGLHAAHTAKDERGEPLAIVHRDVSPQNILVGLDGVARVVDFGVAKAARRIMETEAGRIKGKFRYMAPEQVKADKFDHRVDVFAAGIVLWEALTGRPLFAADEPMRTMTMVLEHPIEPPSSLVGSVPSAVDAVVLRALARSPLERYPTAREMAIELEDALPPAVPRVIGEWVDSLVGETLRRRAARLIELGSEASAAAVALPVLDAEPAPGPAPEPPAQPSEPRVRVQTAPGPAAALEPVVPPPAPLPAPVSQPDATPVPASAPRFEPTSQVSEVSTAAWDTAAQRSLFPRHGSRQLKLVLVGIATTMALALVVLIAVFRARGTDEREAPDVVPVPATNPVAAEATRRLEAPTPAPPSSPESSARQPEPRPEPAPRASAPAPTAPAPTAPAPTAPKLAPKPAGDCNPPWVIDANGIKKFKRHCL